MVVGRQSGDDMKCLLCDDPVPQDGIMVRGNLCQRHHDMLNGPCVLPPVLEAMFLADKADREPFRRRMAELSRTARKDKTEAFPPRQEI